MRLAFESRWGNEGRRSTEDAGEFAGRREECGEMQVFEQSLLRVLGWRCRTSQNPQCFKRTTFAHRAAASVSQLFARLTTEKALEDCSVFRSPLHLGSFEDALPVTSLSAERPTWDFLSAPGVCGRPTWDVFPYTGSNGRCGCSGNSTSIASPGATGPPSKTMAITPAFRTRFPSASRSRTAFCSPF